MKEAVIAALIVFGIVACFYGALTALKVHVIREMDRMESNAKNLADKLREMGL